MAREGMEHWWRAVVVTFAGIFVVSLLGGVIGNASGGSAPAVPGQQHSAATAGATRTAAAAGADRGVPSAVPRQVVANGEAALLRIADLPSGWTSGARPVHPARVSQWSKRLASCVGVPARLADVKATKVDGPAFTSADKTLGVEDSVSVYASAAQARAQYAAMASARTPGCLGRIAGTALRSSMQREAGNAATVGAVSFAGLSAGASEHHMTGFTVTIPLASGGRRLTVSSTQVDFVSGTLLHQVTFDGNGAVFPAALAEQLLAAARAGH